MIFDYICRQSDISLTKLFIPYPMCSWAVIDFYTPIICYVIQREYRNDMVSDDVDAGFKITWSDSKVRTTKPESVLCMVTVGHYYDVLSISSVEFIDKQCIDNETMILSIKLFEKDDNDVKLFKEVTTIVPHDWNSNLFALYMCEAVMKKGALYLFIKIARRMIR